MPDLFTIITLATPIAIAILAGLGFVLWMPRRAFPAAIGQEPTSISAEHPLAETAPAAEAVPGQRVA